VVVVRAKSMPAGLVHHPWMSGLGGPSHIRDVMSPERSAI